MKKILLVGSSSISCQYFYEKYSHKYDFIRMSRDTNNSDVKIFDLQDSKTYIDLSKFDGLVYFPRTITIKQFQRLELSDFQND